MMLVISGPHTKDGAYDLEMLSTAAAELIDVSGQTQPLSVSISTFLRVTSIDAWVKSEMSAVFLRFKEYRRAEDFTSSSRTGSKAPKSILSLAAAPIVTAALARHCVLAVESQRLSDTRMEACDLLRESPKISVSAGRSKHNPYFCTRAYKYLFCCRRDCMLGAVNQLAAEHAVKE